MGRQGRSVGVGILVLLQTVKDDTIAKVFSDNAPLGVCFRAANSDAANQALGDGAAGRGYRPDRLGPDDKGVGYIGGEGVEIRMARFASVVDIDDLETIAEAARQLRIDAGRLSGMAAGEIEPDDHHPDILDRTATLWPLDGAERIAYSELLELLADRYHGDYRRLLDAGDEVKIGKRLRAAGIDTVQVTAGPFKGRKGVRLADVVGGIDARDSGRLSTPGDTEVDAEADTREIGLDGLSRPVSDHRETVVLGRSPVAGNGAGSSGDSDE